MASIPKYTDPKTAAQLVAQLGDEYALVENPSYVFPPFEAYPLAKKRSQLDEGLNGAVMDMDGTTTTTEPLCIHSLEMMVRRITNRLDAKTWEGLDHQRDYPHIIGNSTTKHVEYLIQTYEKEIDATALRRWYLYSAAWTMGQAADEGRRREVRNNVTALGAGDLLNDERFTEQCMGSSDAPETAAVLDALTAEYADAFRLNTLTAVVRASVDIYYQRYHAILAQIAAGNGETVARTILGDHDGHLIEPMPGIGVFLALIKGWLGVDAAGCAEPLVAHLRRSGIMSEMELGEPSTTLAQLGVYFEQHPVGVAIVTSSIAYEAKIVLGEVFRVLKNEVADWNIPEAKKQHIAAQFDDSSLYYDGFLTATDSCEIRLKPHRDLYSLALHQLGLHPDAFHTVVGFEDSESGTIAIRAAGIPICCALPFTMTQGHTFQAATHTCNGGIPEVILRHRVFLPQSLLNG